MAKKIQSFGSLENEYRDLIDTMEVSESWLPILNRYTLKIQENKSRYETVEEKTGVPWEMIGAIHAMEGGLDFCTHLHNGDPLTSKTKCVPSGRPIKGKAPFKWEDSAADALIIKDLDKIDDWSPARVAYELERYNGFGYRNNHPETLSPYLWSGTNHYTSGKYTSDHEWSITAKSKQLGALPIYFKLKEKSNLTKAQLIDSSSHLTAGKRAQTFIGSVVASVTGLFSLDSIGVLTSELQRIREFLSEHTLLIVGGTGVGIWLLLKWMETKNVAAYKQGRYVPSGGIDVT